ncbi:MAG: hypothetical protein ACYDC3_14290 [Candidatus Binataceae bacterium]
MTISKPSGFRSSSQPTRSLHLHLSVRAGLLAALAVVLTLAMLPRPQGLHGTVQSQMALRGHHHRTRRHDQIAVRNPPRRLAAGAEPPSSFAAHAHNSRWERYTSGNLASRAPPVLA